MLITSIITSITTSLIIENDNDGNGGHLLLESGGHLLLEDGGKILLEQ